MHWLFRLRTVLSQLCVCFLFFPDHPCSAVSEPFKPQARFREQRRKANLDKIGNKHTSWKSPVLYPCCPVQLHSVGKYGVTSYSFTKLINFVS